MGNLLTFSYWFNLRPEPWLAQSLKIVYAVFSLLIIAGLMARWLAAKNKENKLTQKLWLMVQHVSLTLGIVGLMLIFARQQQIYIVGMPFLFLLLVIGAAIWFFYIFKYLVKIMPEKKKEMEIKKIKEKYLP